MRFKKVLMLSALCLAGTVALASQSTKPGSVPAVQSFVPEPAIVKPTETTPSAQYALNKTDVDTWLDGYMPYALQTGDIAGAVVVVVKDGQILTARGFGYADAEKRTPVDPDKTLFRPGSISKLVTWTAVMQMVEQKKLDLDADVNTYLDFNIPERAGKPVTLRQIMTHTAGFEEASKDLIFLDVAKYKPLGEVLKAWVPNRIYDAGTTPAYSNYATALAGYMVERVSGEPFDDYVEHHILAPLGMRNSTFRQPLPPALAAQMAGGYTKVGQPSIGFEIVGPGPAGAMAASGTDMGRYMLANLQRGELDGKRILTEATAATMHDSPLDRVDPKSLIGPLNRMELGFFETNINGRHVIGHLGDTGAFHSSLHLFMKEGVGFYVSFNSAGKARASGTVRSALFQDFARRYLPDIGPADGQVDPKVAAEHARMMVGNWENSRRSDSNFVSLLGLLSQSKVEVNGKGELVIPSLLGANGRPRQWTEIAPFVWRDRNTQDRLAANVVDGKVVRWSMDFISPFMVFDRVPAGKSGTWIIPAAYASIGVLLATFLSWPVGALARRKYKAQLALTGSARKAYSGTQIVAGLSLLVLASWSGVFTAMSNRFGKLDLLLWLVQVLGAVTFVAAILVSAWNMRLAFSDGRSASRKFWSVLVLAASLLIFYVALRFGLIAFQVNY